MSKLTLVFAAGDAVWVFDAEVVVEETEVAKVNVEEAPALFRRPSWRKDVASNGVVLMPNFTVMESYAAFHGIALVENITLGFEVSYSISDTLAFVSKDISKQIQFGISYR